MEKEERLELFKEELNLFLYPNIREYAEKAIGYLPDYFFEIPASSTGKYHPEYTGGDGGLIRHVKACMRFAVELFRVEAFSTLTEVQRDLVLVSLLLHDGWKSGALKEKYTADDHPVIAVNQLRENDVLNKLMTEQQREEVYSGIETHMGEWNTFRKTGKEFAPKPTSFTQRFIHFVDYTCSRKMFEVNFNIVPKRVRIHEQ